MLVIKPRISGKLAKHSTTELHPGSAAVCFIQLGCFDLGKVTTRSTESPGVLEWFHISGGGFHSCFVLGWSGAQLQPVFWVSADPSFITETFVSPPRHPWRTGTHGLFWLYRRQPGSCGVECSPRYPAAGKKNPPEVPGCCRPCQSCLLLRWASCVWKQCGSSRVWTNILSRLTCPPSVARASCRDTGYQRHDHGIGDGAYSILHSQTPGERVGTKRKQSCPLSPSKVE